MAMHAQPSCRDLKIVKLPLLHRPPANFNLHQATRLHLVTPLPWHMRQRQRRLQPVFLKQQLAGTLHSWPRNADGSTATCAQVASRAMLHCQFIAQSHAFCMRWLQQQRPHAHARALPEAACARVRCSELAHIALKMATTVKYQRLRDRRRGAEAIIARVHVGHCKAVQVRRGTARSRLYSGV